MASVAQEIQYVLQSCRVIFSGTIFFLLHNVLKCEPTFHRFCKSWKSEYCSVEFQSKVDGTRVVEGLGASAIRALVSNVIAAVSASPMTAKVQTRTTCTDTVNASQGCFVGLKRLPREQLKDCLLCSITHGREILCRT